MKVLQTSALPLGYGALMKIDYKRKMKKRVKGFEPSTSTLARLHSSR
jgi:hypothetical protein